MSDRESAGKRYVEGQVRRLIAAGANTAGVSRLEVADWIYAYSLEWIEDVGLPALDKSSRPTPADAKPIETVDVALLSAESEGSSPPDG